MSNNEQDIAIVGISIFCPAGESVEEFWNGIARGDDFITDAPPDVFDPYHFEGEPNGIDRFYCKRGGFSKAFKVDPLRYGILPISAAGIDPDELISMSLVEQALNDANILEKELPLQNCSIIIGKGNFSGPVPMRSLEIIRSSRQLINILKLALPELTDKDLDKVRKAYQERQGRYQPDMAIGTMPNLVASLVANRYDMHGPAYTVDAACASGILAIDHSMALLRSGRCDLAVAGGMHTGHSPMFWGAFDMLGAMSHKQQIAPFSEDADGLLVGQGAGFVVLKTLERALKDEDRIYAVVKGTAVSSDGAGSHVTVTSVAGEVRVMKKAWESVGMDKEAIGYLEAHGTATLVGDRIELMALKEFFGDNTHPQILLGSIKSNIGHAMPAAGMLGIIKTALALYHRTIPPTLHCENPLAFMEETRFLTPQKPVKWEADRYPLIAGVNAFGFGGINSHAILTVYEPPAGAPALPKPRRWYGDAIMVSAPSCDTLIEKLRSGNFTNTGGTYRIVIFSPDDERLEKAIRIVAKDKPWRGRLDIWFSNQTLLEDGGKLAYLFPGFGLLATSETDSISEMMDMPFMDTLLENQDDRPGTQIGMRHFFTSWFCMEGLARLGIDADLYTGQSVGEWNAAALAGMMDGDWNNAYQSLITRDLLEEYPLVAVSGINSRIAEEWCAEIPDLYLASDNCPSQVLFTGTPPAVDTFINRLENDKIFHTKLPYGAGFHTPLMKDIIDEHGGLLEGIGIHEGRVPIWSATTLEPVPTNTEDYSNLVETQLIRPTYFRGLIEKLYDEEQVRVFVQISPGTLTNFVEDTLQNHDFSVISANSTTRDGIDQLRRVLAALFVEGREVDATFLGVKPMYRVERDLMVLPRSLPPIITELPELTETMEKRYGTVGPWAFTSTGGMDGTTAVSQNDPLLAAAEINMHDIIRTQDEMNRMFSRTGYRAATSPAATTNTGGTTSTKQPAASDATSKTATARVAQAAGTADTGQAAGATSAPDVKATSGKAQKKAKPSTTDTHPVARPPFEEPLHLLFEDHPYLIDHSIVRQPENWPYQEDLNPVVPLAMTIELLAEVALRHEPGRKVVKIAKLTAYRWIGLERPFEGTIKGTWKTPDVLELNLEGHAKAEIHFGDEWPLQPAEYEGPIDVGEEILPQLDPEETYDRFAFHGPMYHVCKKQKKIAARGMIGEGWKAEGKGSLLDAMGQQLGLFLHLTQTENTISFPVRLKEIIFYTDLFDQDGIFEHTMLITRLTNTSIVADMFIKRGGKMWALAHEYVCQRFKNYLPVWNVILKPQHNLLAEEIASGVYHYTNTSEDNVLGLLSKRYLNHKEIGEVDKLTSKELQRQRAVSSIALRDAVRSFVRRNGDDLLYPVEIFLTHDEEGKPLIHGERNAKKLLEGVHVSLAHKGVTAVAIAADKPVGIDLEKIEEKAESFMDMAFTSRERELLASLQQPEGAIRFWVAKEACSKKAGTGFKGNPKRFEVSEVDGEMLSIGKERIQTMTLGEEYIVGWTI
jgi:acyl transferase domain-containing protein/phosphopantetheinyl transferase